MAFLLCSFALLVCVVSRPQQSATTPTHQYPQPERMWQVVPARKVSSCPHARIGAPSNILRLAMNRNILLVLTGSFHWPTCSPVRSGIMKRCVLSVLLVCLTPLLSAA